MTEPRGGGLSWSVITSMEIVVDGVNITTHCDIKRSVFEMHAGPLPGTAKVYVRDLGHELTIVTGSEITLDIEDLRVWGGYVVSITSEYAFPADDTSDPAKTPRYFILDCSDYNILFSKRFIRNKLHPTKRVPKYPAGKHDDEIIRDLFNNYLDLDGDGLNYSKVQYVGTPQEDNPGSPAVPGMSWGTAMRNTALMPGAIYYIDASKSLAYADVDIENAPFDLSDDPNDQSSFGYSNMSIIEDGTMLCNDAFVWGTGLGQDQMTFKRYKDEGSIGEHGRWQWSDYRQDLYRPKSVLKRAKSYVDGSTQNNRGHKDPAITIRCKIRKPGLKAGMKVHFVCNLHGYDDIIPIRSMHITFVNNTEALYELVLAHYLDEAWNTAEFPPLRSPVVSRRRCEQILDSTSCCTDEVCGITDSFDRVSSDGLGKSSSGLEWRSTGSGDTVDGTQALTGTHTSQLFVGPFSEASVTLKTVGGSGTGLYFGFSKSGGGFVEVDFYDSTIEFYDPNTDITDTVSWTPSTSTRFRIVTTQTTADLYVWKTSEAPATAPILSLTGSYDFKEVYVGGWGSGTQIAISMLDVVGVNRCTVYKWMGFDTPSDPGWNGWTLYDNPYYTNHVYVANELSWAPSNGYAHYDCAGGIGPGFLVGTVAGELGPFAGPEWTMVVEFRMDFYYTSWVIAIVNPTAGGSLGMQLGDGDGAFIISDVVDDTYARGTFSAMAGATYRAKMHYKAGTVLEAKVWEVGTTEPTEYMVHGVPDSSPAPDSYIYVTGPAVGHYEWPGPDPEPEEPRDLVIDYIDFERKPCYEGWVGIPECRLAFLSYAYVAGSVKATVNGVPVQATEIDPETGAIAVEFALGDKVIVCYETLGGEGTILPPDGGDVYRPHHVRQLGWGSDLDGENCTMASACIALDRHTLGAKTSNPPEMRSHQSDQVGGTDLNDARDAWANGFGESLNVDWGTSWSSFVSMINSGRGGILQGKYSQIHDEYSSQRSFDGGHAMYINEFDERGYALVYDPLASGPRWMPGNMLRDYAEAFGGGACNVAYTRVTN